MELKVELEKPSDSVRKLKISIPGQMVAGRFERGFAEVQKTARLKGFRPGKAPISVIKQYYGEDVRSRVYQKLIDESFDQAVAENSIRPASEPKIELAEGFDLSSEDVEKGFAFTATVEIFPEINAKDYTGIPLERETSEVTEADVQGSLEYFRENQAELNPISSERPVQKGDHVDLTFAGGLVTPNGIEERPGMKGTQMVEIGAGMFIPGFEDQLIEMNRGDTKTFRITFPENYSDKDLGAKEAEFKVTINEIKEKKLPELNDEFAKGMKFENLEELRSALRVNMEREKKENAENQLQSDLMKAIRERNPFEVPQSLIQSQAKQLAYERITQIRKQYRELKEETVQKILASEFEQMKQHAEVQVRSSLLLDAIGKKEKIEVTNEDLTEYKRGSHEHHARDSKVSDTDLMFRIKQERIFQFLLDKAKIKSKSS